MSLLSIPFECPACKNPDLEALIVIDTESSPGYYSGLPENCYPAEGCEWHAECDVKCDACGWIFTEIWMQDNLEDKIQDAEAEFHYSPEPYE